MTRAFTHGGVFHADDVFAAALLKIYFKSGIEIKRVFKVPKDVEEGDIVFDIGGGKYDHHQDGSPVRENGIPYAAFGLLWREIGPILVGEERAQMLDNMVVAPLDNADNGGPGNPLSAMISAFNPNWDEPGNADACFDEAVSFAVKFLEKEIARMNSARRAEALVKDALEQAEDQRIVVLEQFVPWQSVLCQDERPLFVVFPSLRGGWNAQVVPQELGSRTARQDFPAEWLGEKPEGLNFIHPGRFLIAAKNKDTAIRLCQSILS